MKTTNYTEKQTKTAKNTLISNLIKRNLSTSNSLTASCVMCEVSGNGGNGN